MTAALGHALGQIGLRLERGLQDAERELSQTRERCSALRAEIRSIRAALEALELLDSIEAAARHPARAVTSAPTAASASGGTDPSPPSRHEPAPELVEVRDEQAELVITMPAPTPATDAATEGTQAAGSSEADGGPERSDGTEAATAEADRVRKAPASDDETPPVPAYMPMLEELWAIARREDD